VPTEAAGEATALLESLNERQQEAVLHVEGPLLILAGPGSGKTRVVAHRIAYLIQARKVHPRRILAVTFTNKAAREMRERVFGLVGEETGRDVAMGTFHAICSRLLRVDGEAIGVPRTFTIQDTADQLVLVKRALDDLGLDPRRTPPRAVLSSISRAKSELQGPRQFASLVRDYFQEITARVFERYQELLEQAEALDFDDILVKTVELLQERPDVLEKYADRWEYVHIDEFQDTNIAQYVLSKLWSSVHRNICVVGDPDQSIYTWRSADIRNILNFELDFPDARIVVLDQNYRSTQSILDSAHSVISINKQRKEKNLWTENGPGDAVLVHEAYDEEEESRFVADEIKRLVKAEAVAYKNIAVMYRTNAQSRAVEETLVRRGIPYRLVGGTRFYERREVKDLLAYLRVIQNPFDTVALMRVINTPNRGIGSRTLSELNRWARDRRIPVYAALQLLADYEADGPEPTPKEAETHPFQRRRAGALLTFLSLINQLVAIPRVSTLAQLLDAVIERTEFKQYLMNDDDWEDRWENVQELRAVTSQYDELKPQHALASFLEDVALITDVDEMEDSDSVTLITLHAAKGLEFEAVFMIGMEEGLLPHMRALETGDPAELEEERRLCYVGMTRAKKHLYLLRAFRRGFGGHHPPSRFLADIPLHLIRTGRTVADRVAAERGPRRYGRAERNEESRPLVSGDAFAAGDRVRHEKFGDGIVVSCEPSGGDYQVVVAFQGEAGIKKLLLSFAPLEKIPAA
jgi:DNA helicase-2/ATP-dependent DNA helicase PcrA